MAFDILDNIIKEHNVFLKTDKNIRINEYTTDFFTDLILWNNYGKELNKHTLTWNEVKYEDIIAGRKKISKSFPNETGIYLFFIRPEFLVNNMPKYVFYVGIAGATTGGNTLQKRLRDYTTLSGIKKRDVVERMIYKYYKNLHIAYSVVKLSPAKLNKLESTLIGFFGTHIKANLDDIPVELKKHKKAFNI